MVEKYVKPARKGRAPDQKVAQERKNNTKRKRDEYVRKSAAKAGLAELTKERREAEKHQGAEKPPVMHGPAMACYNMLPIPHPLIRCLCGEVFQGGCTWEEVGAEFDEHLESVPPVKQDGVMI